jgi:hypothetical protein
MSSWQILVLQPWKTPSLMDPGSKKQRQTEKGVLWNFTASSEIIFQIRSPDPTFFNLHKKIRSDLEPHPEISYLGPQRLDKSSVKSLATMKMF